MPPNVTADFGFGNVHKLFKVFYKEAKKAYVTKPAPDIVDSTDAIIRKSILSTFGIDERVIKKTCDFAKAGAHMQSRATLGDVLNIAFVYEGGELRTSFFNPDPADNWSSEREPHKRYFASGIMRNMVTAPAFKQITVTKRKQRSVFRTNDRRHPFMAKMPGMAHAQIFTSGPEFTNQVKGEPWPYKLHKQHSGMTIPGMILDKTCKAKLEKRIKANTMKSLKLSEEEFIKAVEKYCKPNIPY